MPLTGTRNTVRIQLRSAQHNLILYGLLASNAVAAAGPAGIKLDGTLGPSAAALAGPMYAITQNLGKLSGGNLYFSFQYFNVATGETALFSTTSAGINNVISRVTGGYASSIDGTIALQAASGAPSFFLINPSGVTFTANAVIDVPAAFYVSTANYLKFSDGNFYVDPGKMSTLSAAAPEAFGFLGTTRSPVNIQGANLSAGVNGAGDFQIAAGDVNIDGAGARAGIAETTGAIEVTAGGSASAEVPLSGPFTSTDGTVKNSRASNASSAITSLFGALHAGNALQNLVNQTSSSGLNAQGTSATSSSLTTTFGGQVVDVLPNGMLVIEAARQVEFSQQTQTIVLRGLVRPEDISQQNQVLSTAISSMEFLKSGPEEKLNSALTPIKCSGASAFSMPDLDDTASMRSRSGFSGAAPSLSIAASSMQEA